MIEPVILSFGAALLLGLGFGAGPCNITCLPYLGPVFTATEGGIRNSWRLLLPFSLGRMSGYALLGAIAGWAGLVAQQWIDAPWVRWLLGGGTILVALSILWRRRYQSDPCVQGKVSNEEALTTRIAITRAPAPITEAPIAGSLKSRGINTLPTGLFLMGMGMALNPCAPLTTVILAAATTASLSAGLSLGLGFGIGAIIIPTLIFAFGVAHFGEQIRHHLSQWQIALENTSVGLLFLLGTGTAMGWIAP
ncbi:MAG: sulfite exporter TauE/SafE family protein [Sedimenticola sp.]